MQDFIIREVTSDDAEAIAMVHIQAWNETYRGMLPDSFIDSLKLEDRIQRWRTGLSRTPLTSKTVLVLDIEGTAVGFGSSGPQRPDNVDETIYDGEFWAIYVLKTAQGKGLGRKLMSQMAKDLTGMGYKGGSVWVLKENKNARKFYEALGGVVVGESVDKMSADLVKSIVAYGWKNLEDLY